MSEAQGRVAVTERVPFKMLRDTIGGTPIFRASRRRSYRGLAVLRRGAHPDELQ